MNTPAKRDPNLIVHNARVAIERLPEIATTRSWSFSATRLAVAVYDSSGFLGSIDIDHVTALPKDGKPWLVRERKLQAKVMQAIRDAAPLSEV